MANHRGGIVDAGSTYTQHTLAQALGRTPEWVIDNIVEKGCPATELGWLWVISGESFRIWVENKATIRCDATPKKRNAKAVGNKAEG